MSVDAEVRRRLAEATGSAVAVPADTPLLSGGLGLDSVAVVRLLAGIRTTLGVDVADLDLDLDALSTLATLVAFVTEHADPARTDDQDTGEPVDP